jgi:hypothetical protein
MVARKLTRRLNNTHSPQRRKERKGFSISIGLAADAIQNLDSGFRRNDNLT